MGVSGWVEVSGWNKVSGSESVWGRAGIPVCRMVRCWEGMCIRENITSISSLSPFRILSSSRGATIGGGSKMQILVQSSNEGSETIMTRVRERIEGPLLHRLSSHQHT